MRSSIQFWIKQWPGFVVGVVASLAATSIDRWNSNRIDRGVQRAEAYAELTQRMIDTHQAMVWVSSISPSRVFELTREMYDETKSKTGNPAFAGKDFKNIVYTLKKLSDDPVEIELLARASYLWSDVPMFAPPEELDQHEAEANTILNKLGDYYCCLALQSGQDALMCTVPERYFRGAHYCYYQDHVYLPPEGARFIIPQ